MRANCFSASGLALTLIAGVAATTLSATEAKGTARAAIKLFADNCFSPFMTADRARKTFALSGASYDFYDLDPFSSAEPSPALNRAVTPGTDRRCEVSFAGDHSKGAALSAALALQSEGIIEPAALPAQFSPTSGTTLLAARRLNPRRIAIVHVGTREGPKGIETFMLVERLTPGTQQKDIQN